MMLVRFLSGRKKSGDDRDRDRDRNRKKQKHDPTNRWCRFPRVKCVCRTARKSESCEHLTETEVEPVAGCSTTLDDASKDNFNEKQKELSFYDINGVKHAVVVEKNLCAYDLCQLLVLRTGSPQSPSWSVVEEWVNYEISRVLEDHECVLSTYMDMKGYSKRAKCKYYFRICYNKYDIFKQHWRFFSSNLFNMGVDTMTNKAKEELEDLIKNNAMCPTITSHCWFRYTEHHWRTAYLNILGKQVKISFNHVAEITTSSKMRKPSEIAIQALPSEIFDITDYHIYTTAFDSTRMVAPAPHGICLRPCNVDTGDEQPELRWFGFDTVKLRDCWVAAMRLAKYGKQLRENYRAFKNRQPETPSPKDYSRYAAEAAERYDRRVPMDFSGATGRIVEDPKEVREIIVSEGRAWKEKFKPHMKHANITITAGKHLEKPWFHSGMTREMASELLTRYGTVDGAFLVRDSRSKPGAFVLSYLYRNTVHQNQIIAVRDPDTNEYFWSLDHGVTRFFDLTQLVNYYRANGGSLNTKLASQYIRKVITPQNIDSYQACELINVS